MITREQIDFYRENGYLLVERLLPDELLQALRAQTESVVARSSAVTENDDVYDLEDSHSPEHPRVRRIKTPHKVMDAADAALRHPAILEVLQGLLGPAVRLQTTKLNMKSAGFGAPVEWHQDWAFYPHTNDDLLAAGIMLDDVDDENGPLLVVPGSHRGPIYDHHVDGYFCGAIDPEHCDADLEHAVPITGPAGSVSFHHVRAVHGSAVNRSSRQRRLFLIQYTAVDAWPLVNFDDDLELYDSLILTGERTIAPRLDDVPVRMPLPPAQNQGSIYENQRVASHRYFDQYDEVAG